MDIQHKNSYETIEIIGHKKCMSLDDAKGYEAIGAQKGSGSTFEQIGESR